MAGTNSFYPEQASVRLLALAICAIDAHASTRARTLSIFWLFDFGAAGVYRARNDQTGKNCFRLLIVILLLIAMCLNRLHNANSYYKLFLAAWNQLRACLYQAQVLVCPTAASFAAPAMAHAFQILRLASNTIRCALAMQAGKRQ